MLFKTLAGSTLLLVSALSHADNRIEELPTITVLPDPTALLIDRLSREIIAAIGPQHQLLPLIDPSNTTPTTVMIDLASTEAGAQSG